MPTGEQTKQTGSLKGETNPGLVARLINTGSADSLQWDMQRAVMPVHGLINDSTIKESMASQTSDGRLSGH